MFSHWLPHPQDIGNGNMQTFCGQARCAPAKAYNCSRCPRTCGTCDVCNRVLHSLQQNPPVIQDRPVSDMLKLKISALQAPCGTRSDAAAPFPNMLQDAVGDWTCIPQARDCLACPVTCGIAQECIELLLSGAGANYGRSRTVVSHVTSVRHERVAGMQGPSSVAVSADGLHVYVASYSSGSILCFNRNTSTGFLVFNPQGGLLTTEAADAAASPLLPPAKAPSCLNSGDACGGDGYLYHGLKKMTMTSDGAVMYAVSFERGALHTLRRDNATGKLTPLGAPLLDGGVDDAGSVIDGLAGANDVFLSHDERSVYVAASADQAVAYFMRSDTVRQDGLLFIDRVKNGER